MKAGNDIELLLVIQPLAVERPACCRRIGALVSITPQVAERIDYIHNDFDAAPVQCVNKIAKFPDLTAMIITEPVGMVKPRTWSS